jgi:regulator of replication initiation timing
MAEQAALTNVLRSLVNDNDTLKHDNEELQNLLAASREEYHLLQQEIEEHRANLSPQAGSEYYFFVATYFCSHSLSSFTIARIFG